MKPCQFTIELWMGDKDPSSLSPELVLHNLKLNGIKLYENVDITFTIDSGYYDITNNNYHVITVLTHVPLSVLSFDSTYFSFFTKNATLDMTYDALIPEWIGNGYIKASSSNFSCNYVNGCSNIWKKVTNRSQNQMSSIEKTVDQLKYEHYDLTKRFNEQQEMTNRANKCMQDWINLQVCERLKIVENQMGTKTLIIESIQYDIKNLFNRLVQLELVGTKPLAMESIQNDIKNLFTRLVQLELVNSHPHTNPFEFRDVFEGCRNVTPIEQPKSPVPDSDDDAALFEIVQVFD